MQFEYKGFSNNTLFLMSVILVCFSKQYTLFIFLIVFKFLRRFSAKLLQVLHILGYIQTKCISSFVASGYSSFLSLLLSGVFYQCHSAYYVWIMLVNMVCLFSDNNKSKKHILNYLCHVSVAARHGGETVDMCFKLGLAYSCMFPCLLVGIKIILQAERAQTHSECLMG